MLVLSLKYTPITQTKSTVPKPNLFKVRPTQCLNNGGQKSIKKTKLQFIILTHMTLRQGQGHHTWYELVDPKQGYNNEKFEKSCSNSVHEKANSKVVVKSGNT